MVVAKDKEGKVHENRTEEGLRTRVRGPQIEQTTLLASQFT